MKKPYEAPNIEIEEFEVEDIIGSSPAAPPGEGW